MRTSNNQLILYPGIRLKSIVNNGKVNVIRSYRILDGNFIIYYILYSKKTKRLDDTYLFK